MRVVLDTNILVSALISRSGPTDRLYTAWLEGRFELLTSAEQLDEFRRVTRYPRIKPLLTASAAGTMLNHLKDFSRVLTALPVVARSRDPGDNFLLAMAESGQADYLVTGDKRDVLALQQHQRTVITTVRDMLKVLGLPA